MSEFTVHTLKYEYEEFDASRREVRLAELLPGAFEEGIRLKMHTIALARYIQAEPPIRLFSTNDLQASLPSGWVVYETVEGRFLFERDRKYTSTEASEIYWTHPLAQVAPVANNLDWPSARPEYEALSHVWGSQSNETIVHIEDPTSNSVDSHENEICYLPIGNDLCEALRHLRKPKASRLIWVDNICIDQNNLKERNHQVKEMAHVYQLARRVVVWLGVAHDNSSLAMSTLQYLGQQVELVNDGAWRFNSPGCPEPTWSRTMVPLPYDERTWDSIRNLLRRCWFKRLWVWQEAKLGNRHSIIRCGDDEMPLYTFGAATRCAGAKSGSTPIDLQTPLLDAADVVQPQIIEPFVNTLVYIRGKECSDPRDKVYGALGLAPSSVASLIEPDYSRSVSDVYQEVSEALAHATGRVDFLLACDFAEKKTLGPTWAPDWSSPPKRRSPRWLFSTILASSVSMAAVSFSRSAPHTLTIHGVQCSTVKTVGERTPFDNNQGGSVQSTVQLWARDLRLDAEYVTGGSLLDAFVKTVHLNILQERCPRDFGLPTQSAAREQVVSLLSKECRATARTTPPAEQTIPDWSKILDMSLITTHQGYIGITSATVKPDDIICVVLGCSSPLLFRPTSNDTFLVIGTVYVHGLMDAESLLGPLNDREWAVEVGTHAGWYGQMTFRNLLSNDGESVDEDPRLGPLQPQWIKLAASRTSSDPLHFVRYRRLDTGETMNGDPRLLPGALLERGVALRTFDLV